eukprot:1191740-Prorocentrum_minimum.AAC.2
MHVFPMPFKSVDSIKTQSLKHDPVDFSRGIDPRKCISWRYPLPCGLHNLVTFSPPNLEINLESETRVDDSSDHQTRAARNPIRSTRPALEGPLTIVGWRKLQACNCNT